MKEERFVIMVLKYEKPLMEKRLKKHHLTFLEAIPVDRATILGIYGIIIPECNIDMLSEIELYVVSGKRKNYIKYCKDPEMEIAQYNLFETRYNNIMRRSPN